MKMEGSENDRKCGAGTRHDAVQFGAFDERIPLVLLQYARDEMDEEVIR
jgi:hypothetical protein